MCTKFGCGPAVVSKKKRGGGTDRQIDKGKLQLYIIDNSVPPTPSKQCQTGTNFICAVVAAFLERFATVDFAKVEHDDGAIWYASQGAVEVHPGIGDAVVVKMPQFGASRQYRMNRVPVDLQHTEIL